MSSATTLPLCWLAAFALVRGCVDLSRFQWLTFPAVAVFLYPERVKALVNLLKTNRALLDRTQAIVFDELHLVDDWYGRIKRFKMICMETHDNHVGNN